MPQKHNVNFQEAIDIIESLPEYQQEDLINILQRRIVERRREALAKNIRQAHEEHRKGEVKRGSVEELMKDLSEC